ncbi:MAG: hypothetical protein JKY61_11345, partial [Planctomycetes bacterium]|nr:hypothetical protein [Planctomycetota bacterium]
MGMHHEIQPTWTLILGKGPATSPLEPLLQGLAPANPAVRVEFLEGSAPALPAPSRRGRLVLDAAALGGQDLIHVRQYLAEATGWELILLDRDGVPCLARELVGPCHVYWWPGPTTVEQASRLFHPPRARDTAQLGEPASVPETAAALLETVGARKQSPLQFTDPDEELGAIQAILSAPLEDDEGPDPDWVRAPQEPGLDNLDDLEPCGEFEPLDPNEEDAFIRDVDYGPEREDANMHFPVGDPFASPTAAQPDNSWL